MSANKSITARHVALEVLDKFNVDRHDASVLLHAILHRTDQKAQATDLVFGVIRNRAAIDMVITKTSGLPVKKINRKVLNILRIGAYELIFAPKTAQFAIVNEAVNLAGIRAGKKQTGFVNAILRNITRAIDARTRTLEEANVKKTIPQSPSSGCEFKEDILPDPKNSYAEYLSMAFSMPPWLLAELLEEFDYQQVRQICFAGNRRPSVYIRPNPLKTSIETLCEMFTEKQINFEIEPEEKMIKLKSHLPVSILPGFAEGFFTVQDLTAAMPVKVLSPQPGQTIVDICSAPGTKTTQLAELMADAGTIIATDKDAKRLSKVHENCKRLGAGIVKIIPYDLLELTISKLDRLDAILLDVPCSNTGVLAKRPEVRLRITPKTLDSLAKTQLKLLETATKILPAAAKICYSTCSILKRENFGVVSAFLQKNSEFQLEYEKLILPACQPFDRDGGYTAIITKK